MELKPCPFRVHGERTASLTVAGEFYYNETFMPCIGVDCPACRPQDNTCKRLPAVDAVEMVRCRECKWWKSNDCTNDTHGYVPLDENDFCSRGQRREDSDA